MKFFSSYFLVCFIFLTCIFACAFSYPVFSNSGTLTSNQQAILNDAHEEEILVENSIPTVAVVSLNWFDAVDSIFDKYITTRIIDVETGTQYYVKRTGGHNHADVEPIDKENMQKFYKIYGNVWSWERRPVWVEIKGIWVAGSINGMPHGYSLIIDNGQEGHTCVHFLNSRTHGTNRVDENHQQAVEYAFNNGEKINELKL